MASLLFLLALAAYVAAQDQCGWGLPRNPFTYNPLCLSPETISSNPSSWAPWTHPPHCIDAADSPWCVYTNAAVPSRDRRGLSIITTPELATDVFELTDHPLDLAYTYLPSDKVYWDRPYAVKYVPGKGMGAVATQKIKKDRVLLIDHAMLLATVEYPADVMHGEVSELMKVGVERLSDPGRVRVLAHRVRDDLDLSVEESVVGTNSFELPVAGRGYMGLFPDLSRINHACNPNAHIHFSETTLAMTVWSARDIEHGEEITISYSGIELPYDERQEKLTSIWGFNCTCSLCTASEAVRKASDMRRFEFRALRGEILQLAQEGGFQKAVGKVKDLFRIVDEEGLGTFMGDLYDLPARLYYQIGDLETAREYFRRSMAQLDRWGVPGPEDLQSLQNAQGILARLEEEIQERKMAKKRKPQTYLGKKT